MQLRGAAIVQGTHGPVHRAASAQRAAGGLPGGGGALLPARIPIARRRLLRLGTGEERGRERAADTGLPAQLRYAYKVGSWRAKAGPSVHATMGKREGGTEGGRDWRERKGLREGGIGRLRLGGKFITGCLQ